MFVEEVAEYQEKQEGGKKKNRDCLPAFQAVNHNGYVANLWFPSAHVQSAGALL